MELGHLLTRSRLTYPEVTSKVYHDSFCQSDSSVSLPWVIYFEAFYLHLVSSFSCIPLIRPKLVLFLALLQFVYLFCNLSKCILLFFSCISFCCYSSGVTCFNSPSFAAHKLNQIITECGLTISVQKTKWMALKGQDPVRTKIVIDNKVIALHFLF